MSEQPPPWSSTPPPYWPLPAPAATMSYASWGRRASASLIDAGPGLVGAVVFTIGYVELLVRLIRSDSPAGLDDGLIPMIVGGAIWLLALGWRVYNRWFVEGRGGQSLGKRTMKIKLISLQTGAPVGPANACVRDLVHIVDQCACLGYLWPLWDDRRQTFADKIVNTAVIDTSPTP
jgi:uncharacterized RDD family membrane protein YckC